MKQNIILGVFVIVLVLGLVFFVSPGALNRGGGVYIDILQEQALFPKGISMVNYPIDLTIFFGTGWDVLCYEGRMVYYVENVRTSEVKTGGKFDYSKINHDADQRNIPALHSFSLNIGQSQFEEGYYRLYLKNFISGLNDVPYSGDCKSKAPWLAMIAEADEQYSVDDETKQWLGVFEDNTYFASVDTETRYFVVGDVCGFWCRLKLWFNTLLSRFRG